jgi:hypothetical protein
MTDRQRASYLVDGSCFFLFHPSDLPQLDWMPDAFELPDYVFEQGLVVGLELGGGGARAVEVCDGPLAEAECEEVTEPFVFRLEVRHEALYSTDHAEGPGSRDWWKEPCIRVANGKYRAEMYPYKSTRIESLLHISWAEVWGVLKGRAAGDHDRDYAVVTRQADAPPKLELLTMMEAEAKREAGELVLLGADVFGKALAFLDLDESILRAQNDDERILLSQLKAVGCHPEWICPKAIPCPPSELHDTRIEAAAKRLFERVARLSRLVAHDGPAVIVKNETFMMQESVSDFYDAICARFKALATGRGSQRATAAAMPPPAVPFFTGRSASAREQPVGGGLYLTIHPRDGHAFTDPPRTVMLYLPRDTIVSVTARRLDDPTWSALDFIGDFSRVDRPDRVSLSPVDSHDADALVSVLTTRYGLPLVPVDIPAESVASFRGHAYVRVVGAYRHRYWKPDFEGVSLRWGDPLETGRTYEVTGFLRGFAPSPEGTPIVPDGGSGSHIHALVVSPSPLASDDADQGVELSEGDSPAGSSTRSS